jgi:hypothetical protein
MITPKQVYDAWPDNDLLGLDPPHEYETCRAYRTRVGDDTLAADRLFHFALAELCGEDIDVEEADRRLQRACDDLDDVRKRLRWQTAHERFSEQGNGGRAPSGSTPWTSRSERDSQAGQNAGTF